MLLDTFVSEGHVLWKLGDVSLGEHMLYMGNNTCCDLLGVGDCKNGLKNHVFMLPYVMYAHAIFYVNFGWEGLSYNILI